MPEITDSPYTLADKVANLGEAKTRKLDSLGTPVSSEPDFQPATITSLHDLDSPGFEGVTGGFGGINRDGTVNDKTGRLSRDRIEGFDSFEVHPKNQYLLDKLTTDPARARQMRKQRERLAQSRGVPVDQITNEDVFQQGGTDTFRFMVDAAAQAQGDPEYAELIRQWQIPEETSERFRTENPGLDILNIPVERADTGRFGHFGRPLTDVRTLGGERVGEAAGHVRPDISSSELSLEERLAAYRQANPIKPKSGDRFANTLAGFGSTFASELFVKPGDAVAELTGLGDLGTEEELSQATNEFFGYNPLPAQEAMARISTQWDIIADPNASTADKMRAAGEGALEAFMSPETLATSLGAVMSWVAPGAVLKAVGIGSKYAKTAKGIDDLVAAGQLTKNQARARKAQEFLSIDGAKAALTSQSGFIVSSMGNVNAQYDEFVENNNGVELEGSEKAQWFAGRFALQMVNQNIDKIVDFNIIKNPGMLASLGTAAKAATNKEFAKMATSMGKGLAKTTTNVGKEAAQEYSQTMMEVFNSRYGSEQFSNVEEFSAFISDERNTREAGIAALAGAGGAGQFEALGTVGKIPAKAVTALSQAGGKAGEKIKAAKPTPSQVAESQIRDAEVAEEDITPEQAQTNRTTANKEADSVVGKYSRMLGDEEAIALFEAEGTDQEEAAATPTLLDNLRSDPTGYSNAYNELERAEAVIGAREGTDGAKDTDADSLKVLRKTKRELFTNLMQEEDTPTLGSGITPTDVVEEYLDTVDVKDGKLDISPEEEAVLDAYAKDNDIPQFRFDALKSAKTEGKDAFAVFEESTTSGERSVTAHRNKLKRLVNTPNPSKKEIARTVGDIDRFSASQITRKNAFDAVLKEVEADVKNHNQQTKTIPAAVKKKLLGRHEIPQYDGAYVHVSEGSDGKLHVSRSSKAISDSMQDTIDFLDRVKTRYQGQVDKILGTSTPSSVEGVVVRPNTKAQGKRDQDQKFFDKVGVTKAIIDTVKNGAAVWSSKGDYRKDNEKIVNTSKYTEDDVVILDSGSKGFKTTDPIVKEIVKARDANATIIVNSASAGNVALTKLLKRYHLKPVEDTDGVTKYMTEAKGQPLRDKQAKKTAKKRDKATRQRRLLAALAKEDSTTSGDMKQALKAGEVTQKEFDAHQSAIDEAQQDFPGGKADMRKAFKTISDKQATSTFDQLLDVATAHGLESKELSEAMTEALNKHPEGSVGHNTTIQAIEQLQVKIDELQQGQDTLLEWREAQEAAKRGDLYLDKWVKDNVPGAKGIMEDMIETSIGKGRKSAYVTYNAAGSDFSTPTTDKFKIRKDKDGNTLPHQVIEQDPSKYVTVGNATFLNSLPMELLRVAGEEGIAFNNVLDTAMKSFKATIGEPDLTQGKSKNSILPFTNSPVSSLVFDKDSNVNENVVVAMQLGLNTFIKNSAYLLTKGKKSREDIAEILGMDVSQVSREAVDMMNDKGMLYKTVANSIGKEVAGMLGLQAKSKTESDAQAYDALVADIGQTAILMGVKEGILDIDNSLAANDFAKTVLGKNVDPGYSSTGGPKVLFIQAVKGKEDDLETISQQTQQIIDVVPGMDVGRNEPLFRPLTDKEKEKALKKIRNEKLGLDIPDSSQKALTELMDTEWTADLGMMQEMLDNQDHIMKHLGFLEIDSDEYNKLSFEEKSVQEAVNRGVEDSFEHMKWLIDSGESSLYFEYFFSKNGRFFINSNTINPQTDKHLHRFTTQPASHTNTYKTTTPKSGVSTFKYKGKNVTTLVNYALAQGFGFATDKKSATEIKEFAEAAMRKLKTPAAVKAAKQKFIEDGKFVISTKKVKNEETGKLESVPDKVIEIEHFGHAMQAFDFMDKLRDKKSGNEVTSALTAEFDAVTSGFGLKSLQMPVIDKLDDWLRRVGVVKEGDELLAKSMNDMLSSGVQDSYQTLASGVTFSEIAEESFEEMSKNLQEKSIVGGNPYDKNLWAALIDVLPKVEGGVVSSQLRNLFKYPFMTFNYSASIKSIRKNLLTGDMLSNLAKQMAKVDLKSKDEDDLKIINLMKVFAGKKVSVAQLQEEIRNEPMYKIKAGGKYSMEQYLSQMIEASYGAKVEKILTDQFKPFIEAQEKVNSAFGAMFQAFSIEFDKELLEARKKGAVTKEKEEAIYKKLKDRWPMIKGPLSNMEKDGIGIYALETSSPYGPYSGRKPVRANVTPAMKKKLGQEDIRVSHMVKNLAAAIAAGSVVPIHYIDGAVMGESINSLAKDKIHGITSIHDAIMPPLVDVEKAQAAYNKQILEVNKNYSFINEIAQTLERFHTTLDTSGKAYTDKKVKVKREGEEVTMSVKDFLKSSYGDFVGLANDVNKGRAELFASLDKGAHIMHMAGTEGGVYKIEPGSIGFKPVEKITLKEYTTRDKKTKSGHTLQDVTDQSQNVCP